MTSKNDVKFSDKSDLEKVWKLSKIAAKMQFIIYIIFAIVAIATSVASFFGAQASECYIRYPVKKSYDKVKIPGYQSKIIRADGNYSRYNKNYPGNKDCPDCFEWLDSEIQINEDIKNLGHIYLSVDGKVSLCASYLMENNIHKYGSLNNKNIRIPKLGEDVPNLNLNMLANNANWGNLVFMKPDDDLIISLFYSKMLKTKDPIDDTDIFANCTTEDSVRRNLNYCGRYSYKIKLDCKSKCSELKEVDGCKDYDYFPRSAFYEGVQRVFNYNQDAIYVVDRQECKLEDCGLEGYYNIDTIKNSRGKRSVYERFYFDDNRKNIIHNYVKKYNIIMLSANLGFDIKPVQNSKYDYRTVFFDEFYKKQTEFYNYPNLIFDINIDRRLYMDNKLCFQMGSSKGVSDKYHKSEKIITPPIKRRIWEEAGSSINYYSGKGSEIEYFNYSKFNNDLGTNPIDDSFYNGSVCFLTGLPCDYKEAKFSNKALHEFSKAMGFPAGKIYDPRDDIDKFSDSIEQKKLWFSEGAGIIFRFVDSNNQIDSDQTYGNYGFLSDPCSNKKSGSECLGGEMKALYKSTLKEKDKANDKNKDKENNNEAKDTDQYYYKADISDGKYLQLKLYRPISLNNSTVGEGGYLLNIRHSPCIAKNGIKSYDNKKQAVGGVEYIIREDKPSKKESGIALDDTVSSDLNSSIYKIQIKNHDIGKRLWLKIKTDTSEPGDITGNYKVDFLQDSDKVKYDDPTPRIGVSIMDATNEFNHYGKDLFKKIIQNTDILFYIKTLLVVYIMFLGLGIATGKISMSSYEMFTKIVKVIIVAGLINKSIFAFFTDYLYPITTGLPYAILASTITGDHNIGDTTGGSNIFLLVLNYFCSVFSETFLSPSFFPKVISIMTSGFGALTILSILFSIFLISLAICKYMVIFITGFVFNGLLLGLAPIFLTFVLFEKTKYLFDNWVKYIVSFIVEPVIAGLGLIIFVNLFLVYLDSIFNYSVCFKCYIPIYIPIGSLHIDLFCVSWFVPWGQEFDATEFLKSFPKSISDNVALLIISSLAYKYHSIALGMSSKISGGVGSITNFVSNKNNMQEIMQDFDQKMDRVPKYRGLKSFANITKKSYKNYRQRYKNDIEDRKKSYERIKNATLESYKQLKGIDDTKNKANSDLKEDSKPETLQSIAKDSIDEKVNITSGKFWKSKVKKALSQLRSKQYKE